MEEIQGKTLFYTCTNPLTFILYSRPGSSKGTRKRDREEEEEEDHEDPNEEDHEDPNENEAPDNEDDKPPSCRVCFDALATKYCDTCRVALCEAHYEMALADKKGCKSHKDIDR